MAVSLGHQRPNIPLLLLGKHWLIIFSIPQVVEQAKETELHNMKRYRELIEVCFLVQFNTCHILFSNFRISDCFPKIKYLFMINWKPLSICLVPSLVDLIVLHIFIHLLTGSETPKNRICKNTRSIKSQVESRFKAHGRCGERAIQSKVSLLQVLSGWC